MNENPNRLKALEYSSPPVKKTSEKVATVLFWALAGTCAVVIVVLAYHFHDVSPDKLFIGAVFGIGAGLAFFVMSNLLNKPRG